MKFKLKSYFTERLPLVIRRRNNVVYFQLQIDVARADGYRHKTYCEKYKTDQSMAMKAFLCDPTNSKVMCG